MTIPDPEAGLAARLHAKVGVKPWDEIGIAQNIYYLLAAEALAYVRDVLLTREKIMLAMAREAATHGIYAGDKMADAIRALLEPSAERGSVACGYGQNLGDYGMCMLLTGHAGPHKMSGKIKPLDSRGPAK